MGRSGLFVYTVLWNAQDTLISTHVISLATKDLIAQAQYGLDVKAKVLPVYEKIFDIEFPLPKLDTLIVSAQDNASP